MLRLDLFFFLLIVIVLFFSGLILGALFRDRQALLTEKSLRDMVLLYKGRWENSDRLMKNSLIQIVSETADLVAASMKCEDQHKEDRGASMYYQGYRRGAIFITDKIEKRFKLYE